VILHIIERAMWEACRAQGSYRPETLEAQGFIHCSLPEQLVTIANRFYRGRTDLVLLCIDEGLVGSEIRFEEGEPGEYFPHIYGPLNLEAVRAELELRPAADGTFSAKQIPLLRDS
jgi:uncharacterized protein (DUF952 family)